jgi:tetratricopeptide (TPR) repeat protein/MinD-like ATPase involved in chromosome partitioning or flagellar assembly
MIYTFYSYKGGVGRSMALANVAEWLYRQGLRVVVIDWDLEAPGLENFFYRSPQELDAVRSRLGLIDILMAYKRLFPRLLLSENVDDEQARGKAKPKVDWVRVFRENLPPISDALYPLRPLETRDDGRHAALWLLSAGWRAGDRFPVYAQAVQGFDWTDFYSSFEGEAYFNWMREQLLDEALADVVLIDSRTGVTEMGGVCTRQMADVVVSFCVPNAQNLSGVHTMAASFGRDEIILKRGRGLDLVVVPTRIDMNELERRAVFEDQFRRRLDEFTPSAFQSVKATFWDLQIQYIPAYAYEEGLAVNDPSAPELRKAYQKLAAHLALLVHGRSGLQIRAAMTDELQNEFGDRLPSVFISYVGAEGVAVARELRERLSQKRVALWPDLADVKGGQGDGWQQLAGIMDQAKALVLVMTPEAMGSDLVRKQWRYARQQGVSVFFVAKNVDALEESFNRSHKAASNLQSGATKALPQWLRVENYYDADTEWEELASTLQRPVLTSRVPFMAPDLPEDYVHRPEVFEKVKAALRDNDNAEKHISNVALWGPAGTGKSALAASVCQDEDLNSYFEDGIIWATLGEHPNILGELIKIYAALTGERPPFVDEEEAAKALSAKLEGKRCLIVLDNVINLEQLGFFSTGNSFCIRLLTTRNLDIAFGCRAHLVEVGKMSEAEALQFISSELQVGREDQAIIKKLAHQVGSWPLALKLVNTELKKRSKLGGDLNTAAESLIQDFEAQGALALDAASGPDGKGLITQTLESAIAQALPIKEHYDRYIQLAFFPQNSAITLQAVSELWGLDEAETEKRIQHLRTVSLLDYDPEQKLVQLPGVLRSYILSRMPDQEGLNDKLEAAFSHFSPVRQEGARRVLTRLVRLPTPDEDSDDTRQRVKLSDLDASSQVVVESLAEAKIVVVEKEPATGSFIVQIANEAYLKGWKRLRNWIEEDREFLLWRQQLKSKIAEWEETHRDQGALLSGVPLEVASRWLNQRTDDLNAAEKTYIDESFREAERIKKAQQEALAKELLSQRRRRVWTAVATLITIALMATLVYVQYSRQKREEDLRKQAEEIARQNRIKAESYNSSGLLQLQNNYYDPAIDDFSKAIQVKPDYTEAYLNRARVYTNIGKFPQAIEDYTEAIKIKPDQPVAYFERGDVYSRNISDDKAIADYTEAIRLKSDYWNAYLNRGYTYESNDRFDEAIADYTQIINSSSEQFKPDAYLRRGATYLRKKNEESAAQDFLAAINSSVKDEIRDPASRALLLMGRKPPQASQSIVVRLVYNDAQDSSTIDDIENNLKNKGYQVRAKELASGKTNGDVRYYDKEDEQIAAKVRIIVIETLKNKGNKANTPPPMDLKYLGDRYKYVARGNIEVWIPPLERSVQQMQPEIFTPPISAPANSSDSNSKRKAPFVERPSNPKKKPQ